MTTPETRDLRPAFPAIEAYPVPWPDIEFAPEGFATWQTNDAFVFAGFDTRTGLIGDTLFESAQTPVPIAQTLQGPEFVRAQGGEIAALGTTPEGILLFDESSATLLPGTEGLVLVYTPQVPSPVFRFSAVRKTEVFGNITLEGMIYDGGTLTEIDRPWPFVQWLSERELIVAERLGASVLDIETGESERVCIRRYIDPWTRGGEGPDGSRYVLLEREDGTLDLYRETAEGWRLYRETRPDLPDYASFASPEFFEWQGRLWLIGWGSPSLPADGEPDDPTTVALYDIASDTWTALTGGGTNYRDPEAFELDDGSLAVWLLATVSGTTKWTVLEPGDTADPLTDLLLAPGFAENAVFGSVPGLAEDDDGVVTARFESTGTRLALSLEAFDVDTDREVAVLLNGARLGFLAPGADGAFAPQALAIPARLQSEGTNVLAFVQAGAPDGSWGVRGLLLQPAFERLAWTAEDAGPTVSARAGPSALGPEAGLAAGDGAALAGQGGPVADLAAWFEDHVWG